MAETRVPRSRDYLQVACRSEVLCSASRDKRVSEYLSWIHLRVQVASTTGPALETRLFRMQHTLGARFQKHKWRAVNWALAEQVPVRGDFDSKDIVTQNWHRRQWRSTSRGSTTRWWAAHVQVIYCNPQRGSGPERPSIKRPSSGGMCLKVTLGGQINGISDGAKGSYWQMGHMVAHT